MLQRIPPVTRNLLIINIVCFLVQEVLRLRGIDLTAWLGLHFIMAEQFNPFQLVSYMFLHGSWSHLFFNMFSLWMFGALIERTLGLKRFITYYFVCGIGAALCQEVWQTADYFIEGLYAYDTVNTGAQLIPMSLFLNSWTTIGASGACYGVLLAFGMLYPNERIMLLIPPIPMKAKYFVAGYAVIELFSAYLSNDNVAHFAHLGGMLFGFFLLRYWKRRANNRQSPGGWQRWDSERVLRPSLWERVKRALGIRTTHVGNARHTAGYTNRTATRQSDYDYNQHSKAEEDRMDELLDKIRRAGYDSLTPEEKRELFRISHHERS